MAKKKKSTKNNFDLKNFDTSKVLSGNKSYMSLAYGVLAVVVIFIIIFLGIRALSDRGDVEVTEEAQQTEEEATYTVKPGDNLWSIAEEVYNDGYAWPTIAAANNLESPDAISEGMELEVPVAGEETPSANEEASEEVVSPTEIPSPTESPVTENGAITGEKYTVVEGDHLWGISVRAFGDGYRWPEIAKLNNIANPDLIYPGQEFSLPR